MELNTSKKVAVIIARLLAAHGVNDAVLSPGSRNAPLLVAFEREQGISTHVVIDERSAAFIGLGMSSVSGEAVALVCTSGTAPLNYGPALAEAYYRQIPLIAITADRPAEWIDRDDSQTIRQPGIFSNFIKGTFDIDDEESPENIKRVNQLLNEAVLLAKTGVPGPVHVNVRFSEPLGSIEEAVLESIDNARLETQYNDEIDIQEIVNEINSGANTLIVCGFLPENNLSDPLLRLSRLQNVVVLHELQSNLHGNGAFINNIDATLSRLNTDCRPDLVISLGGALSSRRIKGYLRGLEDLKHWGVGKKPYIPDTFGHLTGYLNIDCGRVVEKLAESVSLAHFPDNQFKKDWIQASKNASRDILALSQESDWCSFKAIGYILKHIPVEWNLQVSNGTAIRYAQLFDCPVDGVVGCNRGVSGIDGSTSTAIGAAVKSIKPTLLLTGDMSMQYDLGALGCTFIPPTFKIVVINNNGGGIFRLISSTKNLEELDRCFAADVRLPLEHLSEGFGFNYLSACNMEELKRGFEKMISHNDSPVIFEIKANDLPLNIFDEF